MPLSEGARRCIVPLVRQYGGAATDGDVHAGRKRQHVYDHNGVAVGQQLVDSTGAPLAANVKAVLIEDHSQCLSHGHAPELDGSIIAA